MPEKKTRKTRKPAQIGPITDNKWRPCPAGQYWRNAHYQSTYTTRSGKTVKGHPVRGGCCENPSRKDQIYSEELPIIAKKFASLKGSPPADDLGFGKKGNKHDELIRGWTRFWNDTLKPKGSDLSSRTNEKISRTLEAIGKSSSIEGSGGCK